MAIGYLFDECKKCQEGAMVLMMMDVEDEGGPPTKASPIHNTSPPPGQRRDQLLEAMVAVKQVGLMRNGSVWCRECVRGGGAVRSVALSL